MDAETAHASSNTAVDDEADTATPAAPDADANDGNKSAGPASENFVIFGARLSNLFDDVAVAVDALLTEEVAGLPLLPRTLTALERQQQEKAGEGGDQKEGEPRTGEEKLLGTLRNTYKRNLDLAEAYCARNIFTVQYHSKTMRRKILEHYLAQNDDDDDREEKGAKSNDKSTPLPATTFDAPEGELPSPEQMTGMDREILRSRQNLQKAKRRRIQLKRQLDRLAKASETLVGVREALEERAGGGDDSGESAASMEKLQESVRNAMEGHKELRGWNLRAEKVLQMLDKIKVEREEANNSSGKGYGEERVVGRGQDERVRARMRDFGSVNGLHGSVEHLPSLLKKLRGK